MKKSKLDRIFQVLQRLDDVADATLDFLDAWSDSGPDDMAELQDLQAQNLREAREEARQLLRELA